MNILFFLICLVATTAGAISGIGGGVIIKPVFDAVSGLSVSAISFLSGCTVLAMSAVSLLRSRGGGVAVDKSRGTLLAVGAAAGGVAGKLIFDLIKQASGNDGLIGTVQSVIMVLLTGGVLVYMFFKDKIRTVNITSPAACIAIGLGLGLLSAFLGIGGGPINIAVLCLLFSMDTKTAALNSIYIIFFSQTASFIGTLVARNIPEVDPVTLCVMAAGGVLGGFAGRYISRKMSARVQDGFFTVLLSVIIVISVYNLVHYAMMIGGA